MCSGHMKEGECPIQSVYRELKEELDIRHENVIKFNNLGQIQTPHPKFKDTVCHMYHIVINLKQ